MKANSLVLVLSSAYHYCYSFYIYFIDTSVLLENVPLVKFIKSTSGIRVVYFP